MSEKTRSEKFAQALQQLEQGNTEELLSMFASGARLQRPEQDRQGAEEDAETFWEQYLGQFSEVSTEFERVVEAEDEGILEWRSTATLTAGKHIEYAGVSLLTFEGDEVTRFATYYDTAAFNSPTED